MPLNLHNSTINNSWRRSAFGAGTATRPRLAADIKPSFSSGLVNNLQASTTGSLSSTASSPAALQLPANFNQLKPPVRGQSVAAAATNRTEGQLKPPAAMAYRAATSGGNQSLSNQRAALNQANHTVNRAASRPAPTNINYKNANQAAYAGYSARGLSGSPLRARYEELATEAALRHGLDPDLVKAVICAESSYNPNVVSKAGAMGLMQLMPGTAQDMNVKNPFDPAQNIEGGAKYLAWLDDMFNGDENKILAAYNWGPGNVRRGGRMPLETRNYLVKVREFRSTYQELAQKENQENNKEKEMVVAMNEPNGKDL